MDLARLNTSNSCWDHSQVRIKTKERGINVRNASPRSSISAKRQSKGVSECNAVRRTAFIVKWIGSLFCDSLYMAVIAHMIEWTWNKAKKGRKVGQKDFICLFFED